jgi:hypothetical protein
MIRFSLRCLSTVFLLVVATVAVSPAQTVSGKVSDAISGAVLANAKVTVVEIPKTYTTDSLGRFATDSLSKGTFTIRTEAAGYLKQSKTVMLVLPTEAGSSHIDLDIKLYSLATNADTGASNPAGGLAAQYFFRGHSDTEISICDSTGKVVRTVFDRSRKGGTRTFVWDGKDNGGKPAHPGTYICKLSSGNLYTQRTLALKGTQPGK